MSIRFKNLEQIAYQAGKHSFQRIPQVEYDKIPEQYRKEVDELVKRWGGNPAKLKGFQPKPWLIEIENNIVICLDEHIHFNRYRLESLYQPFYQDFKGFLLPNYQRYCRQYESECAKTANATASVWTSKQSEYFFGQSAPIGDWSANGSSGLKMLALTQYLDDLTVTCSPVKIIRISVWDNIMIEKQLFTLDKILLAPTAQQVEALTKMLKRKIQSIE